MLKMILPRHVFIKDLDRSMFEVNMVKMPGTGTEKQFFMHEVVFFAF